MRLVRFVTIQGTDVWINPDNVVVIAPDVTGLDVRTFIELVGTTPEGPNYTVVEGRPGDVANKLTGGF